MNRIESYHKYRMECRRFCLYEDTVNKDGYFNYVVPEFYEYVSDKDDITVSKFYTGMHPGIRIAAVDFWFSRHYPKGREAIILNATFYDVDKSTEVEVKLDSYESRTNAYRKILQKADRQHWGFIYNSKGNRR